MDQNNNGQQQNSQRQPFTATPKQNTGMSFLLKKGEKLTTALYMVTDIMSEKEPMKWKIRENGVELLSDIAVSYGASASERMSVMSNAIKKIEKIVSFLEITERARMISEMNASVLKKEYLALKDAVEKEWNNIYDKSKSIFSESFFEVPREPVRELKEAEPERLSAPQQTFIPKEARTTQPQVGAHQAQAPQAPIERVQLSQTSHSQAQPQGQRNERNIVQRPMSKVEPRETEQKLEQKSEGQEGGVHSQVETSRPELTQATFTRDTRDNRDTPRAVDFTREVESTQSQPLTRSQPQTQRPVLRDVPATRPHGESGSSERRSIILNKIKEKPSINVRDLADSITHVSEKTIQRELLAMVSEGLLVKRGERRWSTYSLRLA